jgi:hypothetical protein
MGVNQNNGKFALMIDVRDGAELNTKLNNIDKPEEPETPPSNESVTLSSSLKIPIIPLANIQTQPANTAPSPNPLTKKASTSKLVKTGSKQMMAMLDTLKQEAAKQAWGSVEEKEKKMKMLKQDVLRLMAREFLVNDTIDAMQFLNRIVIKGRKLGGFNLLVGDMTALYFYCNKEEEKAVYELVSGEYTMDDSPGLDNTLTKPDRLYTNKLAFVHTISKLGNVLVEDDIVFNTPTPDAAMDDFPEMETAMLDADSEEKVAEQARVRQERIRQCRKEVRSPELLRNLFKIMEDETCSAALYRKLGYIPKIVKRRRLEDEFDDLKKVPPPFYGGLEYVKSTLTNLVVLIGRKH